MPTAQDHMPGKQDYDAMFSGHDTQREDRRRYARYLCSEIEIHLDPATVIDVGCGLGFFLAEMQNAGCEVKGVDADWIADQKLEIDRAKIDLHDLERRYTDGRRYDLCTTFEVAEHLSPERGESFVVDLVALSDTVLFSAAIPGQGGVGHINCRWQSYWAELFDQHDYACYDPFRRPLMAKPDMAYWFKQNMLLYIKRGVRVPDSIAVHEIAPGSADFVRPTLYDRKVKATGQDHILVLSKDAAWYQALRRIKRRMVS